MKFVNALVCAAIGGTVVHLIVDALTKKKMKMVEAEGQVLLDDAMDICNKAMMQEAQKTFDGSSFDLYRSPSDSYASDTLNQQIRGTEDLIFREQEWLRNIENNTMNTIDIF